MRRAVNGVKCATQCSGNEDTAFRSSNRLAVVSIPDLPFLTGLPSTRHAASGLRIASLRLLSGNVRRQARWKQPVASRPFARSRS
ncbi:hypothetical protein BGLA2_210055 [Burkholderia gladioli]|nr:hypothetical protein BGLA2_210055 [Burkholderia gladioli]